MPIVCCLLLTYLAAVAQMTGAANGPIFLPAVVLVLTVRWFSHFTAAMWAFALGLLLDALGTGPLGLQAAIFVGISALLARWIAEPAPHAAWKWMWVVFWTACGVHTLCTACELLPRRQWDRWEPLLEPQLMSSVLSALLVGGIVATWRRLSGAPCKTH